MFSSMKKKMGIKLMLKPYLIQAVILNHGDIDDDLIEKRETSHLEKRRKSNTNFFIWSVVMFYFISRTYVLHNVLMYLC